MKPSTNLIALFALVMALALMIYLFAGSRLDPSLRIAALVAGTGLVSTLAAIASTILTGKDLTKGRDSADAQPPTPPPAPTIAPTSPETPNSATSTETLP